MTIRDLGYRAYEGTRRPASGNIWVILRYGIFRTWGSWIVKLATVFAPLPALIAAALLWAAYAFTSNQGPEAFTEAVNGADWTWRLCMVQLWFILTVISLQAGAGIIAEDLRHRAFQFYFAKPVTPNHYLLGRCGALTLYLFSVLWLPVLLFVSVLNGLLYQASLPIAWMLFLRSTALCALIAITVANLSIAISAVSRSRALTMTSWLLVFVLPHGLANLIDSIADVEWGMLISIPGLLGVLGNAILGITDEESTIHWYHAAPILGGLLTAAIGYTSYRLRNAEVIT